ncbi:MAG: YgiT-type zinc finger protein [Verrucomicrobiia bacterium]
MLKITICPTCGSRKIRLVRRNWTDEFEGQRYTVPNLAFHECPDCGERLYDRDAMRKIEAHSPAYARSHAAR